MFALMNIFLYTFLLIVFKQQSISNLKYFLVELLKM